LAQAGKNKPRTFAAGFLFAGLHKNHGKGKAGRDADKKKQDHKDLAKMLFL